jgi:hypothetical protein
MSVQDLISSCLAEIMTNKTAISSCLAEIMSNKTDIQDKIVKLASLVCTQDLGTLDLVTLHQLIHVFVWSILYLDDIFPDFPTKLEPVAPNPAEHAADLSWTSLGVWYQQCTNQTSDLLKSIIVSVHLVRRHLPGRKLSVRLVNQLIGPALNVVHSNDQSMRLLAGLAVVVTIIPGIFKTSLISVLLIRLETLVSKPSQWLTAEYLMRFHLNLHMMIVIAQRNESYHQWYPNTLRAVLAAEALLRQLASERFQKHFTLVPRLMTFLSLHHQEALLVLQKQMQQTSFVLMSHDPERAQSLYQLQKQILAQIVELFSPFVPADSGPSGRVSYICFEGTPVYVHAPKSIFAADTTIPAHFFGPFKLLLSLLKDPNTKVTGDEAVLILLLAIAFGPETQTLHLHKIAARMLYAIPSTYEPFVPCAFDYARWSETSPIVMCALNHLILSRERTDLAQMNTESENPLQAFNHIPALLFSSISQ